jgi:DNA-binding CsgD family transcriptional regulator
MPRDYNLLPVASLDHTHARHNPWGLTPHQCCTLRLVCKHGGAKQVWSIEDVSLKTVQGHIEDARRQMGIRGHDIRVYLKWYEWYTDFTSERLKKAQRYMP